MTIMDSINSPRTLHSLIKIGFIVPSSNTALEPLTVAMASQLANQASFHFTRLPVKTIDTSAQTLTQFAPAKMIAAAQLLLDAHLDAILWNGTSGAWNGAPVAAEIALSNNLAQTTGVPSSTSTLAQIE